MNYHGYVANLPSARFHMYAEYESDCVEVNQWVNGEGITITVNDKHLSMTHGEVTCLVACLVSLDVVDEECVQMLLEDAESRRSHIEELRNAR